MFSELPKIFVGLEGGRIEGLMEVGGLAWPGKQCSPAITAQMFVVPVLGYPEERWPNRFNGRAQNDGINSRTDSRSKNIFWRILSL